MALWVSFLKLGWSIEVWGLATGNRSSTVRGERCRICILVEIGAISFSVFPSASTDWSTWSLGFV